MIHDNSILSESLTLVNDQIYLGNKRKEPESVPNLNKEKDSKILNKESKNESSKAVTKKEPKIKEKKAKTHNESKSEFSKVLPKKERFESPQTKEKKGILSQEEFKNKLKKAKITIYKDKCSILFNKKKYLFINNILMLAKEKSLEGIDKFFSDLKSKDKDLEFYEFKKEDDTNTYERFKNFFFTCFLNLFFIKKGLSNSRIM